MQKISCKEISQNLIKRLKAVKTPAKIMAAILVGEDPASISFLKQKEKVAKELSVDFRLYKLSGKLTNDDLRKEVGKIARQNRIGGVIVQLPLPPNVNKYYVSNAIPREKDPDVLGERALGAFYNDRNEVLPPAVAVVKEILEFANYKLEDKKVAVVGLGFLIGKPIATWLMGKCQEIYLLDESSNLKILKQADLIISGVGKPDLIKPEILKEGAGVIDFGYSIDKSGKIRGDFDSSKIGNWKLEIGNLWYTPTPGGTGPILIAKLFENFYNLNK